MERYIVADRVCGCPKLTLMDDGSIHPDVHNKPSHGSCDGSAECRKTEELIEARWVGRPSKFYRGTETERICDWHIF